MATIISIKVGTAPTVSITIEVDDTVARNTLLGFYEDLKLGDSALTDAQKLRLIMQEWAKYTQEKARLGRAQQARDEDSQRGLTDFKLE